MVVERSESCKESELWALLGLMYADYEVLIRGHGWGGCGCVKDINYKLDVNECCKK